MARWPRSLFMEVVSCATTIRPWTPRRAASFGHHFSDSGRDIASHLTIAKSGELCIIGLGIL